VSSITGAANERVRGLAHWRVLLWTLLSTPVAFLVFVASPIAFGFAATFLLVSPPYFDLEQQAGFTAGVAAVILSAGALAFAGGGFDPAPWLVAGSGYAALGFLRYRLDVSGSPVSSVAIDRIDPRGTHETISALALALFGSLVLVTNITDVDAVHGGYPVVLVTAIVACLPLLARDAPYVRVARVASGILLGAPTFIPGLTDVFIYYVPAGVMMIVAAMRR
jgi:hypothetical protein